VLLENEMANFPAKYRTDDRVGPVTPPSNSPMRSTVAVGIGVIALALIVWAAGSVWCSQRQEVDVQRSHAIVVRLLRVLSDLRDVEVRECEFVMTGEARYLEPYQSSRKALEDECDQLREMAKNNRKEREQVDRLHALVHQELAELQAAVDVRQASGFDAAHAPAVIRRGNQFANPVREAINAMAEEKQIALAAFSQESRLRLRTSFAALVGSGLLAGCCLLIGHVVLIRSAAHRQQAEEKLAASDSRFHALCEQAPLGIYETDAEGQCVYTNRQWSEMSGLSARDSLGLGWKTVLHPDDRSKLFEGWKTSSRHVIAWEYRLVNGQGEIRWIRAVHGPIHSVRGEVTGYVGTLEDVTERKQVEATLLESEERFRNMADTAPVLIWVSGPDKGCVFFNKVWLDFTGRTMGQELGDGWTQGVHPEDLDRCVATYSAAFDARRRFRMEYRLRRADGQYRWILDDGAPRSTGGGIFTGYIGSCIDITEKMRAEEEARKFMSLTERSLEFVCMWDLEFRPFYVNPAGLRLVGLDSVEAACRLKIQDFFFPEDQQFIINEFFPGVLRDGHGEVDIRFRHFRTGEAIWMLYNVLNILDATGGIVGWATVSTNITERRRAEDALQESRQELRALAGRLLLAQEEERKRISRELHDDLSQKVALLAFDTSSLVAAPPPTPEEMKKSLCSLQARIGGLAADVRQIAHQLHPSILEDLGLAAALHELCEEFSARNTIPASLEQGSLTEDLPLDIASCLYRVAQEALHNVQKHAHGASQVRLELHADLGSVHLCIQDDGIGLGAEAGSMGQGLGIISMKERVRLVQGRFSIHSEHGKGTTIAVCVPLPRRSYEAHASTVSG
jgi:PAS domain S-box-containing protein